jgi:hypothetical protein
MPYPRGKLWALVADRGEKIPQADKIGEAGEETLTFFPLMPEAGAQPNIWVEKKLNQDKKYFIVICFSFPFLTVHSPEKLPLILQNDARRRETSNRNRIWLFASVIL